MVLFVPKQTEGVPWTPPSLLTCDPTFQVYIFQENRTTMSTQLKVKLMSGEEFFVNVDLNGSVEAAKAAVVAAQSYEEGTKLKLICGK